jgi:tetratricopeptide (TPR) repeat protein
VAACRIALKYEWVEALVDCMYALQGHILYGLTGEDAQTFYQEIFDFLQERAPRAALDVKVAAAAAYGRHDEHEACLATHQFVLNAARDLGFERIEGSALRGVGHQYLNQCRLEDALESFTTALAIGEQTRNVRVQVYSLCGLARVYRSQARCQDSIEYAYRATNIVRGGMIQFAALYELGQAYLWAGHYNDAESIFKRAYRQAESSGLDNPKAVARMGVLEVQIARGEVTEAEPDIKRVLRFCTRTGNAKLARHCTTGLGRVAVTMGRYDDAVEIYRQLQEQVRNPTVEWRYYINGDLAYALVNAGQVEGARLILTEMESLGSQIPPDADLFYRLVHARILISKGEQGAAKALLVEVTSELDVLEHPPQSSLRVVLSEVESAWVQQDAKSN